MTRYIAAALAGGLFASGACAQSYTFAEHTFAMLDADRSGLLIKEEVIGRLPGLAAGFDIADRNGDRVLDRPEYEAAIALRDSLYADGERAAYKREVFRALDLDADRAVSKSEAQWQPQVEANFAGVDMNGDGRLAAAEFDRLALYPPAPAAAAGASAGRPR